jgi:hypothetical protein
MREFLTDSLIHLPAPRILDGLASDVAGRRPDDDVHSIAEIVAHLDFWQRWFCARCEGHDEGMAPSAGLGWPAVAAGSWPAVERRFLDGLDRAATP